MNFRGDTIEYVLEMIGQSIQPNRFNFIEIGCMFKENEGLSTYRIAKFIKERNLRARFVSIDFELEHINASISLINKYDKSLVDLVEFLNGSSLDVLPSVIEEMGEVHFAFIDGGAHPEICLKEFELITKALCDCCACLLDDNVELSPTEKYNNMRPFGKGTLIYPFLIVADYLKYKDGNSKQRDDKLKPKNESGIILSLEENIFKDFLGEMTFHLIRGPGGHAILLYGNRTIVDYLKEKEKIERERKEREKKAAGISEIPCLHKTYLFVKNLFN